jgi:hypothetical protein
MSRRDTKEEVGYRGTVTDMSHIRDGYIGVDRCKGTTYYVTSVIPNVCISAIWFDSLRESAYVFQSYISDTIIGEIGPLDLLMLGIKE